MMAKRIKLNIVDFRNIDVSYENKLVLDDFSLTIKDGEHWAILGANGSGKSTLIKMISQELYPRYKTDQKCEIFGKSRWNIWDLKKSLGIITSDLHYRFQQQSPKSRGFEFIISGFYSSIGTYAFQDFTPYEISRVKEVAKILDIELLLDMKIYQMSTGQLRKCLIARALVVEPKALLLDEPTTGLDIKAKYNFIAMLRNLTKRVSVILVTHHLDEIFEEISHICLIKDGKVLQKGKKDTIMTTQNISKCFDFDVKHLYQRG
jgi:iron complex transport system ATP-binding protein